MLWVFAFHLVHAMLNVMLPGASMQENLRSGLLQSNRAAHAALTPVSTEAAWRTSHVPLPLPQLLVRNSRTIES